MALSLSDIRNQQGWHLFEFDVGGEVKRFTDANTPQTVTDAAGNSYRYETGLVVRPFSAESSIATEASAGLEIDDETDWAALEAEGVFLDRRNGTLYRWYTGQALEAARILLRGLTSGAEYDAATTPLTITLERSLRSRSLEIPRPNMRVNKTTWPDTAGTGTYSLDGRIRGGRYPILIGRVGQRSGFNARPGAPALLVQESDNVSDTNDLLLIAGHRITGTSVRIHDFTNGLVTNSALLTVSHQDDGNGRECAMVDLNGSGLTVAKGRTYYQSHGSAGGGIADPRTGGLLRGAGAVLRYLLSAYTTIDLDGPQMDAAAERLDAFKIDAAIYQPTKAIDWVKSKLLPILPVTLRESRDGLYPQFWNWGATSIDAIANIDADRGDMYRVSRMRRVGDVRNEFTIQYRADAATRQHRAMAALSGKPGYLRDGKWKAAGDLDARVYGSYLCEQSQRIYGEIPADDILTDIVWDPATAGLILQWRAARDTYLHRVVQYEADSKWEWLPLGAVVLLTDSEVSLTNHLALVTDYEAGPRTVLFTLTLIDHPLAHTRKVS